MTIESTEKALPGYKSLADVQKKQIEAIENQTEVLDDILIENRISNHELNKINKYKEAQKQGDIKYRTHDMRTKKHSTYLNVFGLFIAGVALAISIEANGIEPIIKMISGYLS